MRSAKSPNACLHRHARSTSSPLFWRSKLNNPNHQKHRLTAEDIEVRVWGAVVIAVTLILFVIVIALLYSVTFVTQPIKSMAPIDQAYTKMLNDIVLLVVGGIGGVMSKRAVGAAANVISGTQSPSPSNPSPPSVGSSSPQPVTSTWTPPSSALPTWVNPALDETWTPPPPPTTPPHEQEPDHEREALALARREAA